MPGAAILSGAGALASASALLEIIGINLLLSGDNALVIAMVMRGLPPGQRRRGIWIGTLGAIVMRVILTLGAWRLLDLPGLRLAGGLTLAWMGWRLTVQPASGAQTAGAPAALSVAIRQVMWADAVMSADNVLAVAGAAHGRLDLLLIGIASSLPLVALGSGLLGRVLERFPGLILAGGVLLGWIGGELLAGDPLLQSWLTEWRNLAAPLGGLLVLGLATISRWSARRANAAAKHRV